MTRDDSDDSSDDGSNGASSGRIGHGFVYGCPACYTVLASSDTQYCTWCDDHVHPIVRHARSLLAVDPAEEEPDGTALVCAECAGPKVCAGGADEAEDRFEGWCPWCAAATATHFADGREAFCCEQCRRLRDVVPAYGASGNGHVARVFADWCPVCRRTTHTAKLDHRAARVVCCDICRAEWVGDECAMCEDEDADPVEIDEHEDMFEYDHIR